MDYHSIRDAVGDRWQKPSPRSEWTVAKLSAYKRSERLSNKVDLLQTIIIFPNKNKQIYIAQKEYKKHPSILDFLALAARNNKSEL